MRRLAALALFAPLFAFGESIDITINTSAIAGSLVRVALDITTSNPQAFSCFSNCVSISNFSAPGSTMQLPDTTGGLITGDLILLSNPAAFTYIDKGFAYNNITVNLSPVGNTITFQLTYTEGGPIGGNPPDQIALFLLDASYMPLFPTNDPLGTNALFTVDLTGAAGGVKSLYGPTTLTGNDLLIRVPSAPVPPTGAPEPSEYALFTAAAGLACMGLKRQRQRRGGDIHG